MLTEMEREFYVERKAFASSSWRIGAVLANRADMPPPQSVAALCFRAFAQGPSRQSCKSCESCPKERQDFRDFIDERHCALRRRAQGFLPRRREEGWALPRTESTEFAEGRTVAGKR